MLTYVINTSENKVLRTDLLFKLVGYNKISWLRSQLQSIRDCATEIEKLQQPMTAGDYRVAVLVDFMAFEKTLYPELDPVSENIAIYRKLIEIYLYEHLYLPLLRSQLGFCGMEVFYIQYTEKNRLLENAAERGQMALLFDWGTDALPPDGLSDESEDWEDWDDALEGERDGEGPNEKPEKKADPEASKKKKSPEGEPDGEGTAEKPEKKQAADCEPCQKEAEDADLVGPYASSELHSEFILPYHGGRLIYPAHLFCKKVDENGRSNYADFYKSICERYDIVVRAFASHSRTYVAGAASARSECRAAFDNLNLSFALIRAYEQDIRLSNDSRADVLDVPKMNKEVFFDTLRRAYGKVQSALAFVRQNGNSDGFYALETRTNETVDIIKTEMTEEERREVAVAARGVKFEKSYERICELARLAEGEKSPEEKAAILEYMAAYKDKRDEMRKCLDSDEDIRNLLQDAKRQDKFPAGIEYEGVVEKKKTTMRKILKAAIDADYEAADYTKEFEEANDAYDRFVSGKARLEKYFRTSLVCFLLVMVAMLVPYLLLQLRGVSSLVVPIALLIAGAFFAGVYVLSTVIHMIPILRDVVTAKTRMAGVYEKCMIKQAQSLLRLKRRYQVYLPAVEAIRYELEELKILYYENKKINRHIEDHREMLENVRDVLLGMLTSMQIPHKADSEIMLDDEEFKISEPFSANRIYKVFTIDVIEEIFEEGGM